MRIILVCILRRPDLSECKSLLVIFGKLAMGEKSKPWSCGQHWILSQASVPQEDKTSHFRSAGSLFWERLLLQYYKIDTHKLRQWKPLVTSENFICSVTAAKPRTIKMLDSSRSESFLDDDKIVKSSFFFFFFLANQVSAVRFVGFFC